MLHFTKRIFLLCLTMSISFFYGQHKSPTKKTQVAFGQLDFLSVKMPKNEVNMDFSGIHYNLMLNNWSYAGGGFYGAVGGIRGGFFTLGINVGVKPKITNNLFFDAGFHFGGGGGASAPDGGGAFILPHLNIGYNFKKIATTLGYSYINFFDKGAIKSNQFYVQVQIPLNFKYTDFSFRESSFSSKDLNNSSWNSYARRVSLMLHANNLHVRNTNLQGKTIRLAGFEFNSYFYKNWFYFIKADGAYSGIKAGYMDLFLGSGYHFSMNKNRTNILAKFGIGAGGGGGVDSKGGFLIYPDISIEQKLFDNIYISVNKGYVMSPNSHLVTSSLGFGLKYYLEKDGVLSKNKNLDTVIFKGIEATIQQEIYFQAKRNNGLAKNMQQIGLQINLFLTKHLYVGGQTSFANFGGAGAYAEGIVGLGIQSNSFLNNKLSAFTQVLAGAAGGGGISTGQGFIVKPSLGLKYNLSKTLNLTGGLGYVKAKGGQLSNTFANVGINYRFSILTAK